MFFNVWSRIHQHHIPLGANKTAGPTLYAMNRILGVNPASLHPFRRRSPCDLWLTRLRHVGGGNSFRAEVRKQASSPLDTKGVKFGGGCG